MNQAPSIPTLDDVRAARERIAPYLSPTPLYRDDLTELVGTEIWVKHENHQPVSAFKVRGGINLAAQLTAEDRKRGLIAASTGNHGQSIAYAALGRVTQSGGEVGACLSDGRSQGGDVMFRRSSCHAVRPRSPR